MPDEVHQLQPTGYLGTLNPIDGMIGAAGSLMGFKNDPEFREEALKYLDRAADRMNAAGVWLFARKEKSYTSAAADFAAGSTYVTTPNDFAWGSHGGRCLDASGNLVSQLEWLDWAVFKPLADNSPTRTGEPRYCSILNQFDAKVYVYPLFSSTVSSFKMPYFARITRPSEETGADLLLTAEAREAMLTGAEAFLMRWRHSAAPAIWKPFMDDFDDRIRIARSASHRQNQLLWSWAKPDEYGQIQTPYLDAPRGTVYIAIS
jgi:hypothetical protein